LCRRFLHAHKVRRHVRRWAVAVANKFEEFILPDTGRDIAVLGCGSWGRNIVRTVNQLGRLKAVVDPSPAGQKFAAEIAPSAERYSDPAAVLGDPQITAVMIATPAETHFSLAREAILAGKDIFVEKPLTIDVDEARELVRLATHAKRILMVGHLLEYHPAILALQRLIQGGELGKVRYLISNRLNLGKIRTEENALWSFAPHDIAVILRLVGELPFEVVATGGCYVTPNIADVTVTQLLFDNGVRSHIFVSWLHPFKEQKLVVIGSRKMASFDDVAKELVLYDQRVDWQQGQPIPVKGEGVRVSYPPDEPLKQECMHFFECIRTRQSPRTDGMNGLRILQILHAAQRSLMTNGHPIPIEDREDHLMHHMPEITVEPRGVATLAANR
jgi:predicted dehydrogenase